MIKLNKNSHMKKYLYGGCKGLSEYISMWKWIRKKGLENVYSLMKEYFGTSWERE